MPKIIQQPLWDDRVTIVQSVMKPYEYSVCYGCNQLFYIKLECGLFDSYKKVMKNPNNQSIINMVNKINKWQSDEDMVSGYNEADLKMKERLSTLFDKRTEELNKIQATMVVDGQILTWDRVEDGVTYVKDSKGNDIVVAHDYQNSLTFDKEVNMTEKYITENAIIKSAKIEIEDHGCLTAWLNLDFGGSGQGFGGFALYMTNEEQYNKTNVTGLFIQRCLEVAGVTNWDDLVGKAVRVKHTNTNVSEIGHIVNNDWFNPKEEFKAIKSKE